MDRIDRIEDMKSIVIFVVLMISVLLVACDVSASSLSGGVSKKEYKEVTIASIYDAYGANPIRGEKLYEDEYLRLSGYIVSIGRDDMGDGPRLLLRQTEPTSFLGMSTWSGPQVEANFEDSEGDDVVLLSVGDKTIVECRGRGFEKDLGRDFVLTQSDFWLDQCRLYRHEESERRGSGIR